MKKVLNRYNSYKQKIGLYMEREKKGERIRKFKSHK